MSFALNSEQLMCMIKCDPLMRENVLGVFPADQLQRLNVGQGLILNTKLHHHPWLAINNSGNFVEVFDSLAALTDNLKLILRKYITMYITIKDLFNVLIPLYVAIIQFSICFSKFEIFHFKIF